VIGDTLQNKADKAMEHLENFLCTEQVLSEEIAKGDIVHVNLGIASGNEKAFEVGEEVSARWHGSRKWYPGTVTFAHSDGTYDILHSDNTIQKGVAKYGGGVKKSMIIRKNGGTHLDECDTSEVTIAWGKVSGVRDGSVEVSIYLTLNQWKEGICNFKGYEEGVKTITIPNSKRNHISKWQAPQLEDVVEMKGRGFGKVIKIAEDKTIFCHKQSPEKEKSWYLDQYQINWDDGTTNWVNRKEGTDKYGMRSPLNLRLAAGVADPEPWQCKFWEPPTQQEKQKLAIEVPKVGEYYGGYGMLSCYLSHTPGRDGTGTYGKITNAWKKIPKKNLQDLIEFEESDTKIYIKGQSFRDIETQNSLLTRRFKLVAELSWFCKEYGFGCPWGLTRYVGDETPSTQIKDVSKIDSAKDHIPFYQWLAYLHRQADCEFRTWVPIKFAACNGGKTSDKLAQARVGEGQYLKDCACETPRVQIDGESEKGNFIIKETCDAGVLNGGVGATLLPLRINSKKRGGTEAIIYLLEIVFMTVGHNDLSNPPEADMINAHNAGWTVLPSEFEQRRDPQKVKDTDFWKSRDTMALKIRLWAQVDDRIGKGMGKSVRSDVCS